MARRECTLTGCSFWSFFVASIVTRGSIEAATCDAPSLQFSPDSEREGEGGVSLLELGEGGSASLELLCVRSDML